MRKRDRLSAARKRGREVGKAAASWVFDGNTSDETYAVALKGIEDGDPEVLDTLDWSPLSGEWAGESIAELLGDLIGDDEDDEVENAYEEAALLAYWHTIETTARNHKGGN